jgi:L-alanine-DL-glutamate epimerase-like enolase superfamily enzyme
MKIKEIRATTVTVPLEAPLRHSVGCHWGRFVRTLVEVEADNGLIGWGEMGGGGASAEAAISALNGYLKGHDPFQPDGIALQQPHPDPRGHRVRLSRPHWQAPQHSRVRLFGRTLKQRGRVRLLSLFPL